MKEFLKQEKFRSLSLLEETEGLNVTGLYAIKVKNISVFPESFIDELEKRENKTLLYIGKGVNISMRLYQECRGQGNGTFFRGIGAILGYKPPKGSLIGRKNQYNYRFSANDRKKIVKWINENLTFNWVEVAENTEKVEEIEANLITENKPIFNAIHNPQRSELLAQRREECRNVALGQCECKEINI